MEGELKLEGETLWEISAGLDFLVRLSVQWAFSKGRRVKDCLFEAWDGLC
jgi:hypothetical protein